MLAQHAKVQFRCTRCGKTTIVELKRRTDETVVISPMPSFARADASTQNLRLPPADDGLNLPVGVAVVLTVESGPERGKSFTLASPGVKLQNLEVKRKPPPRWSPSTGSPLPSWPSSMRAGCAARS